MDSQTYKFLALVIIITALAALLRGLRSSPLHKIPGPWHARFTSLRLKFATFTGKRIYYIHDLHQKYGSIVRVSPTEVAVNDVESSAQIHAVGKSGFEKAPWYVNSVGWPRQVLFTMLENKTHAARRRLFARGFSKSNLRRNWEVSVKQKVELAVSRIRDEAKRNPNASVDIFKWWTLMATDVASQLMFGESFHTLEHGETNEYVRLLTKANIGGGIGAELPLVRTIGKMLPFQSTKELFCTESGLSSYAQVAVRNSKATNESKNVFAQILAEAEKGDGNTLDAQDVQYEATALFIAGTDTTAVSLTYLVWAVLQRPELRRRVEKEVAALPEDYGDADVEELPLLNAVIEETLRLYGAAPGMLQRVVPAGGRDLCGYYVPQGSVVSTHAYTAHRDPQLFPDPLEFQPERFIQGLSPQAKSAFTPFGAGSRTCLGIHMAYSELRLASAEFFRRCQGSRVAPEMTEEMMEFKNFFLIAPRGHRCDIVVT